MKTKSQHIQSLPDMLSSISQITSPHQNKLGQLLNHRNLSWHTDLQEKYRQNYELVLNYDEIEGQEEIFLNQHQPRRENLKQIKQLQSILQNYDLFDDSPNIISIAKYNFYYFRIKVLKRPSPLIVCTIWISNIIDFKRKEISSNVKLKLYISTKAIFPNKFNAEYIVQVFIINFIFEKAFAVKIFTECTRDQFEENFIYISLLSEEDQILIVYCKFGQEMQSTFTRSEKPKLNSFSDQLQRDYEEFLIEKKKEEKKKLKSRKNIILLNCNTQPFLRSIKSHTITDKQIQLEEKVKQVQKNRKKHYESRQIELLAKLNSNQQIQEFREYLKLKNKFNQQNKYIVSQWTMIIRLTLITTDFKLKIQALIERKKRKNFGGIMAQVMCKKYAYRVQKVGKTPEQRMLVATNIAMQIFTTFKYEKTINRSEFIVGKFLKDINLFLIILQKYEKMVSKIIVIQRKFRTVKMMRKLYFERIWRLIQLQIEQTIDNIRRQKQGQEPASPKKVIRTNHKFVIDSKVMSQILEDYLLQKKLKWMNYVNNFYGQNGAANQFINVLENSLLPKLYTLPDDDELKMIIESYAYIKQLI